MNLGMWQAYWILIRKGWSHSDAAQYAKSRARFQRWHRQHIAEVKSLKRES